MTILWQGRWLRSVISVRTAAQFTAAAVVGTGLLLPGAVAATPHSHSRHPLPTALRTSTVADTGTHAINKRHKGKADARPAGASSTGTAAHHGSKRGKGRGRPAEPVDEPIPMLHAHHGAAPLNHRSHQLAHAAHGSKAHSAFREGPAPLLADDRHGKRRALVNSSREPDRDPAPSPHVTHPMIAAIHHSMPAPTSREAHQVDPVTAKPSNTAVANRSDAYAEGVSRPDDDERLPRLPTAASEDSPLTPAPVVRVSAAPSIQSGAQTPVVQGFGGEVALPSPSGTDRPGGTRRRNHPSNWQPESLSSPPLRLEEREAMTDAAVSPAILPELYDRNGRLLMPAPLKGSRVVLVHQNLMATSDGLERITDEADLDRLRAARMLVSFPVSESLRVNEDLPMNRRVARPWTVTFAVDLGHAFYQRFHEPLQVNSAVRTVAFQARLQMVNGNAAAIAGEAASPHLTGQAIDFGKRGMSHAELAWMRGYLLPLMQAGKIDVEEEFQQSCFHISVYRSYNAGRHLTREYAQVRAAAAEAGTGTDFPQDQ